MNLFQSFQAGLSYTDFLSRYGSDVHKQRWHQVHEQVQLTAPQRELLGSFTRDMPVLCLAGAWCGDCINQCPVFDQFAQVNSRIDLRFLDRDDHSDVQSALQINGGNRVPVLVFFSEDGYEVCRYGERPLSRYRELMSQQTGAACPTGLIAKDDPMLSQITQDWLNEFERVQWILRLSPRLRQRHGD